MVIFLTFRKMLYLFHKILKINMANILPQETLFKCIILIIANLWLGFVAVLIWKFLKLDPYNTKVMTTLLIITPIIFLGMLAIFFIIQTKKEI